jgi:hypothetical protein
MVGRTGEASNGKAQASPSLQAPQYVKNNSLFDANATDGKGYTNVERMKRGHPPLGPDGKVIELHHEGQHNTGVRREVSAAEHRQIPVEQTKPSQIDRKAFAKERTQYWKDRAKEFESPNGQGRP